jgi:hypothetical protein
MTTISIKLPEALAQRLDAAARQRQKTKSGLVRDFIERGLLNEPGGNPSFHDLARTHCGAGSSGLRDLATNPKHLEDHGREQPGIDAGFGLHDIPALRATSYSRPDAARKAMIKHG